MTRAALLAALLPAAPLLTVLPLALSAAIVATLAAAVALYFWARELTD